MTCCRAGDVGGADRKGLGGHAERGVRDGGVIAQELFDGRGHLIEVGEQRIELVGVVEERHDRVPDVGRGRVVPGDDQLEQARQHLLVAEPIVGAGVHQHAHQIVTG